MIKTLHTSSAPAAIGPYSQGKIVDGFLFASGQIAINPANGNIEEDTIEGQTKRVCENIAAILKEAGADFDSVIKTTCFLKTYPISVRLTKFTVSIFHQNRHVPASVSATFLETLLWKLRL